jgi:hypothetical protein
VVAPPPGRVWGGGVVGPAARAGAWRHLARAPGAPNHEVRTYANLAVCPCAACVHWFAVFWC